MIAVPIMEWGRVLNPTPGRKTLAVLQASLDASWDQPLGITVVAGYIAALSEWDDLEEAWTNGLALWNIPHFHLRELRKWLRAERVEPCVRYFSNLIECSGLCAVGSALRDVDWDNPNWRDMSTQRLESRYKPCLDMSLDTLGDFAIEYLAGQPVSVLFDADGTNKSIEKAFTSKQSKYTNFIQFCSQLG
jgi:hypothetical protein